MSMPDKTTHLPQAPWARRFGRKQKCREDLAGANIPRGARRLALAIEAELLSPGAGMARSILGVTLMTGCAASSMAASIYVVNTTGDPGPAGTTSLRQAITAANASSGNLVEFAPSLVNSTITLTAGSVLIQNTMTIIGPGSGQLTLSGNDVSGIFDVASFMKTDIHDVILQGLTLTHGKPPIFQRYTRSYGGAISSKYTNVLLDDIVISGCTADVGGGMFLNRGTLTVANNSRIVGNHSNHSGGGIYAFTASLYVQDSTISANSANEYGGGAFVSGAPIVAIRRSLISGNAVPPVQDVYTQGGGGLWLSNVTGSSLILNSTITGNFSRYSGGGIALFGALTSSTATINFSTIAGNQTSYGSDNGIFATAGGSPVIANSIVANNYSRSYNDDLQGSFKVYSSLIRTPGPAVFTVNSLNLTAVDPKLGPLQDNGGATLTMLPAMNSPVIDQAHYLTGSTLTDQRGLPRLVPNFSDMGAVERQYPEDLIFRNGF